MSCRQLGAESSLLRVSVGYTLCSHQMVWGWGGRGLCSSVPEVWSEPEDGSAAAIGAGGGRKQLSMKSTKTADRGAARGKWAWLFLQGHCSNYNSGLPRGAVSV